jgi:hypothetical protein
MSDKDLSQLCSLPGSVLTREEMESVIKGEEDEDND